MFVYSFNCKQSINKCVYTCIPEKNFFIKYNLQIRGFNDHEFLFDHYKGFILLE